jgi:N-acetylglutamate synthase-like GNAT family acetyltransferase
MLAGMSEPLLRSATVTDVGAINELVVEAFGKYVERIGKPPAPMTADYAELLHTSHVWVIEDGEHAGAVLGLLVTQAEPDHLLIDAIAVAPTAQGGGHGRRLLERADEDARDAGLEEIRLCTNEAMTENLSFYPSRGFDETGRGIQDGYHRVFFAKRVEPGPTSRR